jgi:hypothetical protein
MGSTTHRKKAGTLRLAALLALLLGAASSVYPQARRAPWLNGTWEGTGYQMDTDSTWTMRLTVSRGTYSIEYPSLNCGGRWRPVRVGPRLARFREEITAGLDACVNRSTVIVQRLTSRQLAVRFYNRGDNKVTSSAILNRKR